MNNKSLLLLFVRILVNETTEENPLSHAQIIERLAREGYWISDSTFRSNIRSMKDAGIIIKSRRDEDRPSTYLYWYAEGWV